MRDIAFKGLRGELLLRYPLARYTSWRVGGQADRVYRPVDLADLQHFIQQLPLDEPLTFLGLGSNILVRDGGIAGTVVMPLQRLRTLTRMDQHIIRAEAGVTCAQLAKACIEQGFKAGAFFAGIPGTVGGALAMNAGAFGEETWGHVDQVEIMDRSGRVVQQPISAFKVGYRQVCPLDNIAPLFIAGYFRYRSGDPVEAQAHIRQLLKSRHDQQPIGSYSCGSVFRNPPGDYAARLIEAAGLKGKRMGGAMVAEKHANFILNTGHASAWDIEQLIEQVSQAVYTHSGVPLIKEVHILGRLAL